MTISPVSKKENQPKRKPAKKKTSQKENQPKRKPAKKKKHRPLTTGQVQFICLSCNEKELVPLKVVRDFDRMNARDSCVPPQFTCESCGGKMYSEHYKGIYEIEYNISDIRQT
ncbi:hypothetical protein [Cohnella sp. GbtcB17]|uniref:hypothetical protein n=1 Tax=Cohnella sp. GbtcB17 TaxID=2824762 RepID=UPI001C301D62|nr:hypothetical protein [Cohnella sp. GbtcB17]